MSAADAEAGGVAGPRVLAPDLSGGPVKGPASYFPSIEKTYGKPIQEWLDLIVGRPADEKHGQTVAWLKTEYSLGHGHANALVAYVRASLVR